MEGKKRFSAGEEARTIIVHNQTVYVYTTKKDSPLEKKPERCITRVALAKTAAPRRLPPSRSPGRRQRMPGAFVPVAPEDGREPPNRADRQKWLVVRFRRAGQVPPPARALRQQRRLALPAHRALVPVARDARKT